MADINLLPVLDKSQKSQTNVSSTSKKIGVILSILLLIVLLVYASIYGFFYVNGSVTTSSITTLENQVKAQEATEQKIILLRDRTTKIATVMHDSSSSEEMNSLSDLVTRIPAGITLREAKVKPSELNVTIGADQASQITEFIRTLTESGTYSQIESTSMDFSSKDRYIVAFRLVLGQI